MTTAAVAALVVLLCAAPVSADPSADGSAAALYAPPFVDHTEWAHWGRLTSLRVYPTASGRAAAGQSGNLDAAGQAWTEVRAQAPDADTAGMREQFVCHWQFAELAQPGKSSWNLEPWRPVVDDIAMVDAGCNPGDVREPL